MNCYTYLRTSSDDGKRKAGIDVQRNAVTTLAQAKDFTIAIEFVDDGISGTIPMHKRPAGAKLLAALLADGVKTVLVYDGKRAGRTQPVFWRFIGDCRDLGVTVLDAQGTDLTDTVQGGINGLMAEMDRKATVERLAAGKARWKDERRTDGRWPYGEHPRREYDAERAVVARIVALHDAGASSYSIAKTLNADGIRTRYGKTFTTRGIQNILQRRGDRQS